MTPRAEDPLAPRLGRLGPSRRTGLRIFVTLVCLVLGVGTLLGGLVRIPTSPGHVLSCWILPNGSVGIASAWDPGCALSRGERIIGIPGHNPVGGEIRPIASRDDLFAAVLPESDRITVQTLVGEAMHLHEIRVQHLDPESQLVVLLVPAAFAMALMAFGLVILWSSPALAAPPLALLCASFAMALVSRGIESAGIFPDYAWAMVQGLVPASLLHLALNTPLRSSVVETLRQYIPGIYAFALGIVVAQVNAMMRFGSWWSLGDLAAISMLAIGLTAVLVVSLTSMREAPTQRSRARAFALLSITVALLAVAMLIPIAAPPFSEEGLRWATFPLLFVLLTTAIYLACRFAVVEIPVSLRWIVAYPLTAAVAASAVASFAPAAARSPFVKAMLNEPTTLFAACFGTVIALDAVSRLMRGLTTRLMGGSVRLDAARDALSSALGSADHADAVARVLVDTASRALSLQRAALFLPMSDGRFRLAAARGNAPVARDIAARAVEVAEHAARALGTEGALVVPLERALDQRLGSMVDELVDAGVEAIVLLPDSAGIAGLLLVDHPSGADLLSSDELRFLEELSIQGGLALANARLREQLAAHGRAATAGQVAAGIAHDLGRPLGEIFIEARSLKRGANDPRAGLETIQELAEECMQRLEALTRPGTSPADEAQGPLNPVIGAAAARIAKLSRGHPPVLRPAAGDIAVSEPRSVQRVIENLLENAYRWGGAGSTVEVRTERRGDEVWIEVIDDGVGMDEATRHRALDPYYSGAGGTGLGLAICRDVVGRLGGSLSIDSEKDAGTRVRVVLPVALG